MHSTIASYHSPAYSPRLFRVIFVIALSLSGCAAPDKAFMPVSDKTSNIRTYYIAAENVLWDYAPSYPVNRMTGKPFTKGAEVFVQGNDSDRIGHKYWKALYREYTDETFTTPKPQAPEWEHLGTLGPVIRGVVDDTIVVVFKNMTTDQRLSVHPHGLFYDKSSEGTPYDDGTSNKDKFDDGVAPGAIYQYTWRVPERAGPTENDPSSIVWMYHSHVNEPADTNAGLIGPIIITRQDAAQADGSPQGIDREFINLFTVFDENVSLYRDRNIEAFASDADPEDEEFQESNLMHATNGYLYGNLPNMTMKKGERVRWYLISMGTEVDLHTPHWHGNTVTWNRRRTDVIELLPGSMKTVDMNVDNPGLWMYHCHVNDHIEAGMMATYRVMK